MSTNLVGSGQALPMLIERIRVFSSICFPLNIINRLSVFWPHFVAYKKRLKGCLGWGGSWTSILTSYLKSAGLISPAMKFSSYSVKPLHRYYSIQTSSKVGKKESLNLGFPSYIALPLYVVISLQYLNRI